MAVHLGIGRGHGAVHNQAQLGQKVYLESCPFQCFSRCVAGGRAFSVGGNLIELRAAATYYLLQGYLLGILMHVVLLCLVVHIVHGLTHIREPESVLLRVAAVVGIRGVAGSKG